MVDPSARLVTAVKMPETGLLVASFVLVNAMAPLRPGTASESPDLESARARERMVILDIRTLMMAGREYAEANGTFVDELRCLGNPAACLASFPADAPSFLDPTYDYLRTRLGYTRKFHPGPKPAPEEIRNANASATSLRAFAYTAVPERRGETGVRGFCGDSAGRFCFTPDGSEPPVKDGRCGKTCKDLK
jgi:hypothetical protein